MSINVKNIEQLAACLVKRDHHDELELLLGSKLAPTAQTSRLRYFYALSLAKRGQTEEALQVLKELLRHAEVPGGAQKLYVELCFDKLAKADGKLKNVSELLLEMVTVCRDTSEFKERLAIAGDTIPLIEIRSGCRQDAISYWEKMLDNGDFNFGIIHNLAVVYYWWISSIDNDRKRGMAEGVYESIWNNLICYWNIVLNSAGFWTRWKEQEKGRFENPVSEQAVESLKNRLITNRFTSFIEEIKKDKDGYGPQQCERYLAALSLEQTTGRLWLHAVTVLQRLTGKQLPDRIKQFELIRGLQAATESVQCFGTQENCRNSCCWAPDCFSSRNRVLMITIPGGSCYFKNRQMDKLIGGIVMILQERFPEDYNLALFRVYVESKESGLLLELARMTNTYESTVDAFRMLPDKEKETVAGKYVFSRLRMAEAHKKLNTKKFKEAFNLLKEIKRETSNDYGDFQTKRCNLDILFSEIKKEVECAVENACDNNREFPEDDAIALLETAMSIVESNKIKETLAVHYVQRGQDENGKENFKEAKSWFEKALTLIPGHESARMGISICYNNQATNQNNRDKALEYYQKAIDYMPGQNERVIRNYAGCINGIAVDVLDSVNEYNLSSKRRELDRIITLLKKGVKMVNPLCSMQLKDPDEFYGKLQYINSETVDDFLKDFEDNLLKLLVRHLYLALKYRSYIY